MTHADLIEEARKRWTGTEVVGSGVCPPAVVESLLNVLDLIAKEEICGPDSHHDPHDCCGCMALAAIREALGE